MADKIRKSKHTVAEIDAAIDMLLEGYTRDEINELLSQKITAVPGSGLITDTEKQKLDGLENYNDSEVKSQIVLNRSTLGYQSKNLLKNTATSATQNGVTFTVNADKSVTVNGTATGSTWFQLSTNNKISTGRYIVTSGVDGYDATLRVVVSPRVSIPDIIMSSIDSSAAELSERDGLIYAIRVQSGVTYNNVVVYPMIRYAEITDATYEPYKPSVEERLATLEAKIAAMEGGEI